MPSASPGRRVGLAAIFILTAALLPVVLSTGAAAAPRRAPAPTVGSVTARLDALARQAERLAEQYNQAQIEVAAAQRAATIAQQNAAAAATAFSVVQDRLGSVMLAQYETGSFSTAGALLSSANGDNFLQQMSTLNQLADQQARLATTAQASKKTADAAAANAAALLRAAESKRSAVTKQRQAVTTETAKFSALLNTLTGAQRSAYLTRDTASPAQIASLKAVHAGSAAAQRAVAFALAQLGKPYVFGATGPSSYDCSGLTMAAWAAGGVSLPHFAASQYNYGTHVALANLQPGDLVFLYQPIGHVSIYAGNGLVVSAPQPGENVQLVPVSHFASDFSGATRLT